MKHRTLPATRSEAVFEGVNPTRPDNPPSGHSCECPDDELLARELENQARLQRTEERLGRILDLGGIAAWDADFLINTVWVSPMMAELLGYKLQELQDLVTQMTLVYPDDLPLVREALWASREEDGDFEVECRLRHASDSIRWYRIKGRGDWNTDGELDRFSGTVVDIDEHLESEQVIEHLSLHDELTDLPNRSFFQKRLEDALREKAASQYGIGLLLIDLNDFREINDAAGHSAGDAILRQVATRLVGAVRGYDFVARLGGDEFGVLLRRIRSPRQLSSICEHLLEILSAPCHTHGRDVSVTASIGITAFPGEDEDAEDLLVQAELAMYEAKRRRLRGGAFEFYEPRFGNDLRERLRLDASLETALKDGELKLYFQPEIAMKDGQMIAVEALVRWQHPQRGLLGPNDFIPTAEASGRIILLGDWVISEACREIARFSESENDLRVAINLSPLQFQQGNLPEIIARHIAETGIPARLLEVEITESVLISDLELVRSQLERIHHLGCFISLDDFGSGYSSLTYLHQFPIDQIKIDRSFVNELHSDEHARIITRSIINLGRSLGMSVLAEGVESCAQYSWLGELGCDVAQGFLLARPMPGNELLEWQGSQHKLPACNGCPVHS